MGYSLVRTLRISIIHTVFLLTTVSLLTSCGIKSAIRETNAQIQDAIDSFDRAITALAQESADWRVVMYDLEKDISEDVQSTIRTEIDNLTRSAILMAGSEIRCNSEFIRIRLERELTRIRNNLAREINVGLAKIPGFNDQIPLLPEKPNEPFFCSIVPSAVDLGLDPKRRPKMDIFGFDLRSRPISVALVSYGTLKMQKKIDLKDFKGILRNYPRPLKEGKIVTDSFVLEQPSNRLKKDITPALSIISDFHAVLDLTESGVDIEPNAQEIVFSWNDQIKSEIPILTHQQILDCEIVTKTIYPEKASLKPPALADNVCDGKPDKDFAGHGPCVRFHMSLFLDAERKKLKSSYWMNAWECPDDFDYYKEDCTECVGSGSDTLYVAQDNEKILSFDVEGYLSDQYIDNDHEPDKSFFAGAEPAAELRYVGDTSGDEAGSKTRVEITFRRINLQIEKCEFK